MLCFIALCLIHSVFCCDSLRDFTINQQLNFTDLLTVSFNNLPLIQYGRFGSLPNPTIIGIKYKVIILNIKSNVFTLEIPSYISNVVCSYQCMNDSSKIDRCFNFTGINIISEGYSTGNVTVDITYCDGLPTMLIFAVMIFVILLCVLPCLICTIISNSRNKYKNINNRQDKEPNPSAINKESNSLGTNNIVEYNNYELSALIINKHPDQEFIIPIIVNGECHQKNHESSHHCDAHHNSSGYYETHHNSSDHYETHHDSSGYSESYGGDGGGD